MTKEEIQYEAQSIIQEWGSNDSAPYVEFVEKLASMELPESLSNLDDAAKECAIREGYLAGLHHETMKRVFKAGAKWDAGQGYVDTQAVINEYEDWGDGFAKLELGILKNDDFFKDWKKQNEIIVQIRKKQ